MPYRILEYEIEIMKSAIDIRKIKNKEYKLPLVIPIVLYTGKKRWDAKRYLEESQETLDGVKIKAGNYNLVNINDFTKEELLQEKTKELIEKIDGGEEKMLALVDMIRNENKMYINMGRKEGIKEGKKQTYLEIAKNLLKLKMPISQISEVTKLPKEEIEKLK